MADHLGPRRRSGGVPVTSGCSADRGPAGISPSTAAQGSAWHLTVVVVPARRVLDGGYTPRLWRFSRPYVTMGSRTATTAGGVDRCARCSWGFHTMAMLGFRRVLPYAISVLLLAGPTSSATAKPAVPLDVDGLVEVAQLDMDGTENQHMAFDGDLAFITNVDGFRVVDIGKPKKPVVLADVRCRAGREADVSTFHAGTRRYLIQSVDRPQTTEDCSSTDTTTVVENGRPRAKFGFEGLRLFDITDATNPRFLTMYRTSCGAHVHTLVPDPENGAVQVYVASYPLFEGTTPTVDREKAGALACVPPHQKFPIVTLPLANPTMGTVREKALSSDTQPFDLDGNGPEPAFIGARHFQAFLPLNLMICGCSGDAQYWSITDRSNPTSADGEPHTHLRTGNGIGTNYLSGASVTWDGEIAVINDSTASSASCQGDASTVNYTWYFPVVTPGFPPPPPLGKYTLPRAQGTQLCAGRAGTVLPTTTGYLMTQAFLQGGTSLVDVTDTTKPREIAHADIEDTTGKDDTFTAYWYNGYLYANSGINRRGQSQNRGLEIFEIRDPHIRKLVRNTTLTHLNPFTQE